MEVSCAFKNVDFGQIMFLLIVETKKQTVNVQLKGHILMLTI